MKHVSKIANSSRRTITTIAAVATAFIGVGLSATLAEAASCWNHNGSVMRIEATGGGGRVIRYQNPKSSLRSTGVRSGTILFNGTFRNGRYSGTARRFSRFCVGSPQHYGVSGPANNRRIVLRGRRDKNRRCVPTGVMTNDKLVFTFLYPC